jgi:septum formation protein
MADRSPRADEGETPPLLILASGSPQRRALLDEAGYRIQVIAPRPHAECGVCSRETPPELVARLARQKAADVADQLSGDSTSALGIIACDTVASCAGQILGKPTGQDHARWMLELLSGQEHHVYSGLCLWPLPGGSPRVEVARTVLRMDPLTPNQIDEYLASGLWEGKAGAFGYQDRVGWLHVIEGSESNVIGLPLELLAEMVERAGWRRPIGPSENREK